VEQTIAKWRAEALARLPELSKKIETADSVMAFWNELWHVFEDAYKAEPPNESLIARVYAFADWCVAAPRGPDATHEPLTAASVCFYEEIPACKPARDDMPRWFTYDEVAQSKQVFQYMIGEQQYFELLRYMDKHRKRYVPRAAASNL
jgi:hypothetical protein